MSLSLSGCKPFSGKASKKSKSTKRDESTVEPTFEMILPNKLSFDKDLHSRTLSTKKTRD
ncbi:hypothetical protein RDI58_018281 [Solanum bulbocastanum]|uniref:Uncharacterized protein n=1 Tax=Solanum bulbocastanum TaxID=147425 RepID=A0AAN8YAT3_SOLBU